MTIRDLTEVLTLEVEVPDTGLRNYISNPSGELGAWGWTTLTGTLEGLEIDLLPYTKYLEFTQPSGGLIGPESEAIPVTPGEYISASWTTRAHSPANAYLAACIRFYDSAGTYVNVTQQTPFSTAVGRHAVPPALVPAGVATARLMFLTSGSTPSYTAPPAGAKFRFHDVAAATAATAAELGPVSENLLPNPSFETNTTGWLVTGGVLTRTQEVAATAGAWRGKITRSGTGPVTLRTQATVPTFNGYTYRFQADRGTTGPAWSLQVEWRNLQNVVVATTTVPQDPASASGVMDAVAPPGGLSAWPRLISYGTAWPDALMFTRTDNVGTPPDYFDGDTPDTSTVTYSWTGTPHASKATRSASQLPFIPPIVWRDILGSTASINIQRRTFDATLQAIIRDITLDPAQEQLLRPGRRVRVTAPPLGNAALFTGRIRKPTTEYNYKRAKEGKEATVTLTGYGVAADLAAATRPDGVAAATDLPHVLEGVTVPYDVDGNTGQVPPPAIVSRNPQATALDQVVLARDTSLAYAWVNRAGVLMVRTDRTADYYPPNQALELDESVYTGLSVAFDPDDCINSVTVLRLEPKTDTPGEYEEVTHGPYEDATSVRQWGRQAREFRIHGSTDPATYAAAILAANAQPTMKVSDLRLRIRDTDDLSPWVLADIYGLAHITNTRAGIDTSLRVLGVDHNIQATATKGVTWDMALSFTGGEDQVAAPVPTTPLPPPRGDLEDTGWINLTRQNGWQIAVQPQYRRIGKTVYLRGRVQSGTTGSVIGNLPADCRPTSTMTFVTMQAAVTGGASAGTSHTHNLGNSSARVDVTTAGNIDHAGPLNNYVSLDGIVFRTD